MEYKVIRSQRKSTSITIYFNNEVVVRCPNTARDKDIERFIESKREWIEKTLLGNEVRNRINKDVIEYSSIYLQGKKVPLKLSQPNSITESGVSVRNIKQIRNLYISYFEYAFEDFVKALARSMHVRVKGIELKSFRSKWGCCDQKGIISFNYRIFMLPIGVMRYVVLHELCHIVYFNHSEKFWSMVERFEPDYKNFREDLKNFDFLTRLY